MDDSPSSISKLQRAAAQGHAGAQYNLGLMFANGQGVAQDFAEAARLYSCAAAQGVVSAQCNLGNMFQAGQGVAQDYAEAVRLYRLAVAQGHAGAQFNLGYMFYTGEGVAQDFAEAARLYHLAAAQGHTVSQFNLGYLFYTGEGVAQDFAKAARLYRLAALQGHSDAQFRLGCMFAKGQGVAQNDEEAERLFRLAAAQGHEDAQYNMDQLLVLTGRGVAPQAAHQNGCILFLHFTSGSDTADNPVLTHLRRVLFTEQLSIAVTPMSWSAFQAAPKQALENTLCIVFYGAGWSGMDVSLPESLPPLLAMHHKKNAKPFVSKKSAAGKALREWVTSGGSLAIVDFEDEANSMPLLFDKSWKIDTFFGMTHSFNKSASHAQLYSKAYSPQPVPVEVRVIRSIPTDEIVLGSSDPRQCLNPLTDLCLFGEHMGSVMVQTRCLVASATFGSGKIGMFCDPALKAVSSCLVAFVSSVVQHFASENDRQSQDDQIQTSCVYLFGASGVLSHAINGSYDITHNVADGYHIYAKRDGDGMIIEHHGGQWGVKHLRDMGTAATVAHVEGGCAINLCTSRPWRVGGENVEVKRSQGSLSYSGDFVIAANLKMLIGSDAEREAAVEESTVREENRSACLVSISGAAGINADLINGVYEPTQETRGGRIFYVKRGNDRMCIEHCAGRWQVKLLAWKGNPINIKAHCSGNCPLDACNSHEWVVNDGQRWVSQSDVRMAAGADAEAEWTALSSPASKSSFCAGCKVTIVDLKSRPELNGCGGKIIGSFNAESGRWPVKIIPKTGTHEELLLRPANIVPRTQTVSESDVAVAAAPGDSGSGIHRRNRVDESVVTPSASNLMLCGNPDCGKMLRQSKKVSGLCRGCATIRYCSSSCQQLHWPHHETVCHLAAKVSQMVAHNPAHALQLKKEAEAMIPCGRPLPRGSDIDVILTGTALDIQLHFQYSSKKVEENIEIFRRKHQPDPARAIESCESNLRRWPPGEACLDRSPNGKWHMLREVTPLPWMTVLESIALDGIGGGGFEHINLAPGQRMVVPKGCVGVQAEPGKCTIIRPASGAKLESQRVVQEERNLIVVYHVWQDGQREQMFAGDLSSGVDVQHGD